MTALRLHSDQMRGLASAVIWGDITCCISPGLDSQPFSGVSCCMPKLTTQSLHFYSLIILTNAPGKLGVQLRLGTTPRPLFQWKATSPSLVACLSLAYSTLLQLTVASNTGLQVAYDRIAIDNCWTVPRISGKNSKHSKLCFFIMDSPEGNSAQWLTFLESSHRVDIKL